MVFDKLKERYEKHYVRLDQLKKYVMLGVITELEYELISEKPYSA